VWDMAQLFPPPRERGRVRVGAKACSAKRSRFYQRQNPRFSPSRFPLECGQMADKQRADLIPAMSELTLSLRGLPTHTAAALRSMLALLDSALGARWRLIDAPMADVILVPGERMTEIRKTGGEEEVPLLLALTSDNVCPAGAFAVL